MISAPIVDLETFCRRLKFAPTPKQIEVFNLVDAGEDRIGMAWEHEYGASSAAAVLALWRMLCIPHCMGMVVTPTRAEAVAWIKNLEGLVFHAGPELRKRVDFSECRTAVGVDGKWLLVHVEPGILDTSIAWAHTRGPMTIVLENFDRIMTPYVTAAAHLHAQGHNNLLIAVCPVRDVRRE